MYTCICASKGGPLAPASLLCLRHRLPRASLDFTESTWCAIFYYSGYQAIIGGNHEPWFLSLPPGC
jgi:hypothetical protein